ncbi:MAG: response regulator, partial [Elainellaceae cyanobacterium]
MSSAIQPLRKILLVDDSLADRRLVTREIYREFSSVEIREAADLQTFEQVFPADPFDLVITDYELKWATGIDILQRIKAHDTMLPVVMFTDSGSQEIAVEAMKAGLDDYVLKSPKHLIRLSQAVQTAWENSQLRRRADQLDLRQRFLLNQLEVGVFRANLEGQLIEVNDGFLRLLGLSSLEQAKPFFQDNFGFTAVDRAQAGRHVWEKQLRRPDGQTIWVQVNESLVEQQGQMVIDGLVSDITE